MSLVALEGSSGAPELQAQERGLGVASDMDLNGAATVRRMGLASNRSRQEVTMIRLKRACPRLHAAPTRLT